MGIAHGWIAPTLKLLQNSNREFSLTTEQCSWVASLQDFGRILGPILSIWLIDLIGRKKVLASCTILFFFTWLLVVFTRSVAVIYAVRLLYGFTAGLNDATATIYLGENSKPKLRGIFSGISITFFYAAVLIEICIAIYFSYETVAIVNTILSLLTFPCIYFGVEPVQFLVMKERYEEAENNFNFLRGVRQTDKTEFEKIKSDIHEMLIKKLTFKELIATPSYYKSVIKVLILCTLIMATGSAAIFSFVSITFSELNVLQSNNLTILFGLLQFASVCCCSFIIEKVNRRTMLLISLVFVTILHACTTTLYYVHKNISDISHLMWLCFIAITMYSMIFIGGIIPVVFAIRGELFSQNLKNVGGAFAVIGNSLMAFCTTKIFLLISKRFGIYANFAIYSIASLFTIIYVYFFIPETRGKSLIEIQNKQNNI
ncbi:hypothetical protein PGB90_001397 [Kerria lacca]